MAGLRLTVEAVIRLLHTADWHLGATLQGWSREPEHRAALAELVEIARARAFCAPVRNIEGDLDAIVDALRPMGVNDVAMPASPMTVWKTIQAAGGAK